MPPSEPLWHLADVDTIIIAFKRFSGYQVVLNESCMPPLPPPSRRKRQREHQKALQRLYLGAKGHEAFEYIRSVFLTRELAERKIVVLNKLLVALTEENWAECDQLTSEDKEIGKLDMAQREAVERKLEDDELRAQHPTVHRINDFVDVGYATPPLERLRERHRTVKEKFGEYKTTLASVYTYPLLFDGVHHLTARFEECLVAADDARTNPENVASYCEAVTLLEHAWTDLAMEALNGKTRLYPPPARDVLCRAQKLAAKADSTESVEEQQELYRKAVMLGETTTVRVPTDLRQTLMLT